MLVLISILIVINVSSYRYLSEQIITLSLENVKEFITFSYYNLFVNISTQKDILCYT